LMPVHESRIHDNSVGCYVVFCAFIRQSDRHSKNCHIDAILENLIDSFI